MNQIQMENLMADLYKVIIAKKKQLNKTTMPLAGTMKHLQGSTGS